MSSHIVRKSVCQNLYETLLESLVTEGIASYTEYRVFRKKVPYAQPINMRNNPKTPLAALVRLDSATDSQRKRYLNMHGALLLLKKIPKRKVVTYKELAKVCKTSPRAIGRIMASNKHPKEYPCYKVVGFDGQLCGYSGRGGLKTKAKLLRKDKIQLKKGRVAKGYFYRFP